MDKIQLNVSDMTQELVIRSGEAPEVKMPESVRLDGNIFAPSEYVNKRRMYITVGSCHVLMNRRKRRITLVDGEGLTPNTTVTGSLDPNSDLEEFNINTRSTWKSPEDLARLFRRKKRFFQSPEICDALVAGLRNYNANVETEINKSSDNRGNASRVIRRKVATAIESHFTLNIPLFDSGNPISFTVDICLDVNDDGLVIWLESTNLEELQTSAVDEVFDAQKAIFEKEKYVVIEQ